ncbi:MAG TPA: CBS domain-containing protein [Saprospiraceae bacterium]|nr:CBS domain-containing protein [Saprospiraceae bacterium]
MIAREIISNQFIPVLEGVEVNSALKLMNKQWVKDIPVIDEGKLVGILTKDDLMKLDPKEKIDIQALNITGKYVNAEDHLLEVIKHMVEHKLTAIPVVLKNMNYIGTITQDDIMQQLGNTESMAEPGGIIVLDLKKQDYSLADIAHIVENEGATILNLFITATQELGRIEVSIKLNTTFLASLMASFDRHNYIVKAYYEENEYSDTLKERYDGLMSYLSI